MKKTGISPFGAHLREIKACFSARIWATGLTAAEAWATCESPDWLLWWAGHTDVNPKQKLVIAGCACARTALKYVPDGELRPLRAIEAAEAWANDPTEERLVEVRAAAAGAAAATASDDIDPLALANPAREEAGKRAAKAAWAAATSANEPGVWAAIAATTAAVEVEDAAEAGAVAEGVDEDQARDAARKMMCSLIHVTLDLPWKEPEEAQ